MICEAPQLCLAESRFQAHATPWGIGLSIRPGAECLLYSFVCLQLAWHHISLFHHTLSLQACCTLQTARHLSCSVESDPAAAHVFLPLFFTRPPSFRYLLSHPRISKILICFHFHAPTMSSNEDDPRIVRISSEERETAQSQQASPGMTDSPENFPSFVSRFGHFIFHDDEDASVATSDFDRQVLIDALTGEVAYDRNEFDDDDGDFSGEFGNEDDRDLIDESDHSRSDTPLRHLPPLDDQATGSPHSDAELHTVLDGILRGCLQSVIAEFQDEKNDAEVEGIGTNSSGSIVNPSIPGEAQEADEDQESDKDQNTEEDHGDHETEKMFKSALTNQLRQMMFVSGETAEPSVETTTLIEEITRQQVIEIVSAPLHHTWSCLLINTAAHSQHRTCYSPWLTLYLD